MSATNGDGEHDPRANAEFDNLVVALHAAREQTERGEDFHWGEPVVRFVHAVAAREAERFPPPLREHVEAAVVRGGATTLSMAVMILGGTRAR